MSIPDSVESIGDYAFDGCSSLQSVVIGGSVTSIGDGAFDYDFYDGEDLLEDASDIRGFTYVLSNGRFVRLEVGTEFSVGALVYEVTSLDPAEVAVAGCDGELPESNLEIPGSLEFGGVEYVVTSIGEGAFSGLSPSSVSIPVSVTSIGDGAFEGMVFQDASGTELGHTAGDL